MAIKTLDEVYNERIFRRKGLRTLRFNLDEVGKIFNFKRITAVDNSKTYDISKVINGKYKNIPLPYFEAGIFQIVDDKIVPGVNANKRMVMTKEGFKSLSEVHEANIKRRIFNELAYNAADNLTSYDDFKYMSLDEIDSRYDPTKRAYWNFHFPHVPTERFYEARRKRWKRYAKKHGTWWLDQAKREIERAEKNEIVHVDRNALSHYLDSLNGKSHNTSEKPLRNAMITYGRDTNRVGIFKNLLKLNKKNSYKKKQTVNKKSKNYSRFKNKSYKKHFKNKRW